MSDANSAPAQHKPRPLIEDASKVIAEQQIKVELTAKEKSFLDQYAK